MAVSNLNIELLSFPRMKSKIIKFSSLAFYTMDFVQYDPDFYLSSAGTPGGPAVRVMYSGFVFVLHYCNISGF